MSESFNTCIVDIGRPCYDVQCAIHGCKRERINGRHPRFRPILYRPPDESESLHRAEWEQWWTLQSYESRDMVLKRTGFSITFRDWGWDELPTYIRDEFLLHDTPRSTAAKPRE